MVMPKFVDFQGNSSEVRDIMERFLERFPGMFEGFDSSKMAFLVTEKKKAREPIRLHRVPYPMSALVSQVYIVEVFRSCWKKMDTKKRNLGVFRAMCAIPDGGFDEQSKNWGKLLQPEIRMFLKEYAACGGVPNWMENPAAVDPMERTPEEVAADVPDVQAIPDGDVERTPVTLEAIEAVAAK